MGILYYFIYLYILIMVIFCKVPWNPVLFPCRITDGMNDTKDKVKFLESLKRHFDQLYSIDSTPATIINTAIPGLANSVKQMDSISRYYSRAGFLGLMFTKVLAML